MARSTDHPAAKAPKRRPIRRALLKAVESVERRRGRPGASFSARGQILTGAAKQFGEVGYAQSSVEDILVAAGVSRRTFYRFFPNKEELLVELFETAGRLLLQSIRAAVMVGKSNQERIENAIEVFLRGPQTLGPLAMVFHLEATRPDSKLGPRREAIIDEIVPLLDYQVLATEGVRLDPLVYRGLIAALEQISLITYTTTPAEPADLARAKRVMVFMTERLLLEAKSASVARTDE